MCSSLLLRRYSLITAATPAVLSASARRPAFACPSYDSSFFSAFCFVLSCSLSSTPIYPPFPSSFSVRLVTRPPVFLSYPFFDSFSLSPLFFFFFFFFFPFVVFYYFSILSIYLPTPAPSARASSPFFHSSSLAAAAAAPHFLRPAGMEGDEGRLASFFPQAQFESPPKIPNPRA